MNDATNPIRQDGSLFRRITHRGRYVPLVILVALVLLSVIAGVIVNQRNAAIARNNEAFVVKPSDSAVCQPEFQPDYPTDWAVQRDANESAWASHAIDLNKPYVVGPNGWVFWNDQVENYVSQAVGRKQLNSDGLTAWRTYLTDLQAQLSAQGIAFYAIITPSTSSIYPEELPTWMQALRGPTVLDSFMNEVRDLPVIDLRQQLTEAKAGTTNHLYSWTNSHWTDLGAYVAWSQIADCVNSTVPAAGPLQVPKAGGVDIVGEFNEWAPFGFQGNGPDWARPVFTPPLQDVTISTDGGTPTVVSGSEPTDLTKVPAETTVTQSWTGKSALVVRDSMGSALSVYLQQAYSPTWQVGHAWDDPHNFPNYSALVAKYHPDVVVLQIAERHLELAPIALSETSK